jgi:preprotein translocase subunit YajC
VAELVSLLPIIAIALLFWLLIIRPQSRRSRALAELQSGLNPGDQVMLSSGVFGVVDTLTDERVHLRIAEGVTIEVARGAVANVVRPEETSQTEPTTDG